MMRVCVAAINAGLAGVSGCVDAGMSGAETAFMVSPMQNMGGTGFAGFVFVDHNAETRRPNRLR